MGDTVSILYGQEVVANLENDDGPVDLTGATVLLQARIECGTIMEVAATVTDLATAKVSAAAVAVGHYQMRWKVTIGSAVGYFPEYAWDTLTVRAVDACKTFDFFVAEISNTVFPEDEAENLLANHRKYIVDALIDLQQKVPCVRAHHRDRVSQPDTFLDCGASVVSAPRGFIADVYAVTQDNCCAKRTFQPINHDEMVQILKDNQNCGTLLDPTYFYYVEDIGYIDYPAYGCLYYADSTGATDADHRPSVSYVSIHNGLLYLFPWLQANEVLVIEWDGIKRSWRDNDEVTYDREISDACEHFLAGKSGYREDCDVQKIQIERGIYSELVAKLIWQCRKENRLEKRVHYFSNCGDFCNTARQQQNTANEEHDEDDDGGAINMCCEETVENYTELRALNPTGVQSAKVLGYATAFDGGGGVFIRRVNTPPQTDNDGDIIESGVSGFYYWRKWV